MSPENKGDKVIAFYDPVTTSVWDELNADGRG